MGANPQDSRGSCGQWEEPQACGCLLCSWGGSSESDLGGYGGAGDSAELRRQHVARIGVNSAFGGWAPKLDSTAAGELTPARLHDLIPGPEVNCHVCSAQGFPAARTMQTEQPPSPSQGRASPGAAECKPQSTSAQRRQVTWPVLHSRSGPSRPEPQLVGTRILALNPRQKGRERSFLLSPFHRWTN